jgi:hypothetical protein
MWFARTRTAVAGVVAACLVAAACTSGGGNRGGGQGAPAEAPVRILSPAQDARVIASSLEVRVRAGGPGFRARLDGKDVTGRFRAADGGVRRATLRLGRDFELGTNTLTVEVGETLSSGHHAAVVTFRALRRDDRRLAADVVESTAAPGALRVRATHDVVAHRVWVNGRAVAERFAEHADGRGLDLHLTARHGLRQGANRVTVELEHPDGTVSRATRTVTIDTGKPLPDAGPDRVAAGGRPVPLDASGTLLPLLPPGSRGASYTWTVVSGPEGANPTIDGTGKRATFRPDRPGEYRLRLSVAVDAPGGNAAARLGGHDVRLAAAQGTAAATDEAVVTVALGDAELGVPIQTINRDGGITIGDPGAPDPANRGYTCQSESFLLLLVLDAKSLMPSGPGCRGYQLTATDMAQLACDVLGQAPGRQCPPGVDDDDLVILTGRGVPRGGVGPLGNPVSAEHQSLGLVLSGIGATTDGRGMRKVEQDGTLTRGLPALYDTRWSVIGMRGMPRGSAWQNYMRQQAPIPGYLGGDPGRRGSLNGYLRQMLVSSPVKQFVQPEYAAIDTDAGDPDDPFTNVIKVGDQTYTARIGGGKALGVHLVVLNADDLSHLWDWTYLLRDSEGRPYADGLHQFARAWDQVRDDLPKDPREKVEPRLVIAQTFGNTSNQGLAPVADTNWWVNDQLPGWGKTGERDGRPEYFAWCGGGVTKLKGWCTTFPTDPTALGDFVGPTYGIGILAGMSARTAVANFGRGGTEAMTVVGPTRPYADADVFVKVGKQADRLVGTLRRTNQSVWHLAVGSPTDAGGFDPTEFWKLAVGPAQPWPLDPDTGGDRAAALAEAHGAVVRKLWPGSADCVDDDPTTGPCDVRDFYPDFLATEAWKADKADLDDLLAAPYASMTDAGKQALADLVPVLKGEFDALDRVRGLFAAYERLISSPDDTILADALQLGAKVKAQAFKDLEQYQEQLERERARVNTEAPIGEVFHVAAAIFEVADVPFLGGGLALVASSYNLFSGIAGTQEEEQAIPRAPFDPDVIETTVADAASQLRKAYARQWETFERLLRVIVSSPDKLQTAYLRATATPKNGGWFIGIGSNEAGAIAKATAIGIQRELFRAIMPAAYEQWVVSPAFTQIGNNQRPADMTTAGPRNYSCGGPDPFRSYGSPGDVDDPSNVPDESIHWVRFEQSDPRNFPLHRTPGDASKRNHATGRGLKAKANPIRLTDSYVGEFDPEYYVDTAGDTDKAAGSSPPGSLMAKLFRAPTARSDASDPDGLAMDKDEFFGMPTWTMPKLMCGVPKSA